METKGNSRTFVMGTVAGIVVAAALGAAFMLGQGSGSNETAEAKAVAEATATQQASTGATQPSSGDAPQSDGGSQPQDEPAPTETPVATEDAEEDADPTATATATATATSTPTGECAYCIDGDLIAEPTPVDPCPLCNDLDLMIPVDLPPSISNISTSFCFPNLVVKFDLEDADVVWFSFTDNGGVTHEAQHIDADTFDGYMSEDVGDLGWGVYFLSNLRVHATDDQGHHVWSDEIPMPEPDLGC